MGTKMVSLRLDEGLLAWATDYARSRGCSRTKVVEAALRSFREDCAGGVPELAPGTRGDTRAPAAAEPANPTNRADTRAARSVAARPAPTRVPGVKTARQIHDEQMLARQMRLNRVKK